MKIKTKRVGPYMNITFDHENSRQDYGLHNSEEARVIASELREGLEKIEEYINEQEGK